MKAYVMTAASSAIVMAAIVEILVRSYVKVVSAVTFGAIVV